MDGFVIRIYRREQKNGLVGIAEELTQGRSYAFRTADELWRILQGAGPAKSKKPAGHKQKTGWTRWS